MNVDGFKSAEPPIKLGSLGAIALRIFPEAARVANPLGSAGNSGIAESQPAGSSPRSACSSSLLSQLCFLRTQRRAVRLEGVLLAGRAVANVGPH